MKINFVSGNLGKFEEAKEILEKEGIILDYVKMDKPEISSPDVKEVAEYAAKKLASKLNKTVVVEDTGFYLEAYEEFPGTNSKPIFKSIGLDGFMRLLEGKDRSAFFKTVVSYCKPGENPISFEGRINGTITKEVFEGGHNSLPYDRIFIPNGHDKTFSQDPDYKNKISHRVEAFNKFAHYLKNEI